MYYGADILTGIGNKKHIIIVAILLFAGFAITNLVNYYVSLGSLRKEITENELPITGDTIYSEIQRDLLQPIFISSIMAQDTFLRDWVIEGEVEPEKIIKYLKEIKTKYGTVSSFFVSDRTNIYYYADGILKTVDPDEKRDVWYYRVRSMEEPYEINVDIDMANSDTMTIFINYRVLDYEGNFIGATGVGMTVDSVIKLIGDYQKRYNRDIYFIDREGNIRLARNNEQRKGTKIFDMKSLSSLADKILSRDTPGETNYFTYTREGKVFHLNTRFIPEFKWFLFVEQDESETTEQIRHALFMNLFFGAIISIIVIVLVYVAINSYERRLETTAMTDSLTGISNRLAFEITLENTLALIEKEKRKCTALLIDIDHFKEVNDNYDHFMGDNIIRHVTGAIRGNIRRSDFFGRWGGDEFIVLLRDTEMEEAYLQAERLRNTVKDNPYIHEGDPILVTISIGVAEYEHGEGEDNLLSRADKALYLAKKSGRDRTARSEA